MRRLLCFAAALLICVAHVSSQEKMKPPPGFLLHADSPDFWKLIPEDAKLEVVAKGFGFTEGPVWDPAGFLYVSDEEQNKIYKVSLDGSKSELISLGDPDGNTYDAQHRLVDCASVLRAIIQISADGKYTVLTDRFEGRNSTSPNDVVLGPDGALYFTDPSLDLVAGEKQELEFQGVFRLDGSGKVTLLTKELSQPNGLAFSPDGKKFYVDDSKQRNIRVYDFSLTERLRTGASLARNRAEGPGSSRRQQGRSRLKSIRHRARGDQGLDLAGPAPWYDSYARAAQSRLGRCRSSHALHHSNYFGLQVEDPSPGLRCLI